MTTDIAIACARRPDPTPAEMPAPILILSGPRTGSTVLRYILDSHPDICCPPELRFGPLVELLSAAVELTASVAAIETSEVREQSHFMVVRRILEDVMRPYCLRRQKRRWCEKTPINVDALNAIWTTFPDAHYICLHRHALDMVKSCVELWGKNPDHVTLPQGIRREDELVGVYVDRWCTITERLLAFETSYKHRSLRVRYEDLVTDADREVERISAFLGVTVQPNLAAAAFAIRHDAGPGCYKIQSTTEIEPSRVGSGRTLDLSCVSPLSCARMDMLLDTLGYR